MAHHKHKNKKDQKSKKIPVVSVKGKHGKKGYVPGLEGMETDKGKVYGSKHEARNAVRKANRAEGKDQAKHHKGRAKEDRRVPPSVGGPSPQGRKEAEVRYLKHQGRKLTKEQRHADRRERHKEKKEKDSDTSSMKLESGRKYPRVQRIPTLNKQQKDIRSDWGKKERPEKFEEPKGAKTARHVIQHAAKYGPPKSSLETKAKRFLRHGIKHGQEPSDIERSGNTFLQSLLNRSPEDILSNREGGSAGRISPTYPEISKKKIAREVKKGEAREIKSSKKLGHPYQERGNFSSPEEYNQYSQKMGFKPQSAAAEAAFQKDQQARDAKSIQHIRDMGDYFTSPHFTRKPAQPTAPQGGAPNPGGGGGYPGGGGGGGGYPGGGGGQGGQGGRGLYGRSLQQPLGAFEAPYMRQFNEQIAPEIAERYIGGGNARGSGFQNAIQAAGAGLSENLAALKEQMVSRLRDQQLQASNIGLGYSQLPMQRYGQQQQDVALAVPYSQMPAQRWQQQLQAAPAAYQAALYPQQQQQEMNRYAQNVDFQHQQQIMNTPPWSSMAIAPRGQTVNQLPGRLAAGGVGALTGAAAGSAFGPWGTAGGGVLGGLAGLLGGGGAIPPVNIQMPQPVGAGGGIQRQMGVPINNLG